MTSTLDPRTCVHARARATTYDDHHRWVVSCRECGQVMRLTHREWLRRLDPEAPAALGGLLDEVQGDAAGSGRLDVAAD